jgi:hypothetical protein
MNNSRRFFAVLAVAAAMAMSSAAVMASAGDLVEPPQLGTGPGGGEGPSDAKGSSNKRIPPRQLQAIIDRFEDSLHATRIGKQRFYSAYWHDANGSEFDNGGFEHSVIDLYGAETAKYETLACKQCHYPPAVNSPDTDTDAVLFPGDCSDCHWNYDAGDYGVPANEVAYCDVDAGDAVVIAACGEEYDPAARISQDGVCLACHSRQGAEHNLLTDVHRAIDAANPGEVAKFGCMGCHHEEEVHGDGVALESHLDNPKTSCAQSGCHERELKIAGGKKATGGACSGEQGKVNERCESFHLQHVADVDCTSCHVQSNTTCNSCHFDSELEHRKRFYRQIPAKGFTFLMNFKDIQDPDVTKVRTATYQSLTVGAVCVNGACDTADAQTFAVFAPYAAHSVSRGEELRCRDCHVVEDGDGGYAGNPAVVQYLAEGTVTTTTWNDVTGLLDGPSGIIPLPHDWIAADGAKGALDMDFAYYLGNTDDPVTKNPAGDMWDFLKTGPDRGHMPYGTPLSAEQMQALILDEFPDE